MPSPIPGNPDDIFVLDGPVGLAKILKLPGGTGAPVQHLAIPGFAGAISPDRRYPGGLLLTISPANGLFEVDSSGAATQIWGHFAGDPEVSPGWPWGGDNIIYWGDGPTINRFDRDTGTITSFAGGLGGNVARIVFDGRRAMYYTNLSAGEVWRIRPKLTLRRR